MLETFLKGGYTPRCFHPFQGRPLFGLPTALEGMRPAIIAVSIPFREDLYSDSFEEYQAKWLETLSFHPFQGRPLFGQAKKVDAENAELLLFPSLSGKTSIRTHYQGPAISRARLCCFHPFQGRPLFGLGFAFPAPEQKEEEVSIPFREDLYSDTKQET